jgi:hypothetical protein
VPKILAAAANEDLQEVYVLCTTQALMMMMMMMSGIKAASIRTVASLNNSTLVGLMSTKALLKQAMLAHHLCADATYKLVLQGFPVLIVGTTDFKRKFHPFSVSVCSGETGDDYPFIFSALKSSLFEYTYRPTALIADGADAITNVFMSAFDYASVKGFTRVMC